MVKILRKFKTTILFICSFRSYRHQVLVPRELLRPSGSY